MLYRVALLAALAAGAVGVSSAAKAQYYYGRGCASGACGQPPSQIVDSATLVPSRRVVYHDRVVPRTEVVDHNQVVLHRHTLQHHDLTIHRHRIQYHTTVLHRYNTLHRQAIVPEYYYAEQHQYQPVYTVEHRRVSGYDRWCNCGQYARAAYYGY